jgi:hypothetical protein
MATQAMYKAAVLSAYASNPGMITKQLYASV